MIHRLQIQVCGQQQLTNLFLWWRMLVPLQKQTRGPVTAGSVCHAAVYKGRNWRHRVQTSATQASHLPTQRTVQLISQRTLLSSTQISQVMLHCLSTNTEQWGMASALQIMLKDMKYNSCLSYLLTIMSTAWAINFKDQ